MPVLSTHSTSTRARVSIDFISWSNTLFCASRIAESAKVTDASRNSPSGIIPITAAAIDCTDNLAEASPNKYCCENRIIPIGTIAIPAIFTNAFKERTISDCSPVLIAFAFKVSCEAYDSAPTFVSRA